MSTERPQETLEAPAFDPAGPSFDDLFATSWSRIVAVAYAVLGSRAAAEDVAQEAFLRGYTRWDRIAAYDRPDLWVRRVALNLAISRRRRVAREAAARERVRSRLLAEPAASEWDELDGSAAEFWHAVRALPRRQAEVVVLYYVDDLSTARIAETLRCAEGTVRAHLHRARQALAVALRTGGEP
jgi:RNA polymerase sigma-70 factor (ECF subfamily)